MATFVVEYTVVAVEDRKHLVRQKLDVLSEGVLTVDERIVDVLIVGELIGLVEMFVSDIPQQSL